MNPNFVLLKVDKDALVKYLKGILKSCDWQNVEANVDKFSYASILWERYRSNGVRQLGVYAPLKNGGPVFERNARGEDIYYVDDILCFSKQIIISTLRNIHRNLKRKCLEELKWANELI